MPSTFNSDQIPLFRCRVSLEQYSSKKMISDNSATFHNIGTKKIIDAEGHPDLVELKTSEKILWDLCGQNKKWAPFNILYKEWQTYFTQIPRLFFES